MTHTHTESPWLAYNTNNGRILKTWSVCDKRGFRIAKIEEMPGQSGEEEMANARLIAGAPELLAALKALEIGLSPASLEIQKDNLADLCRTCFEITQQAIAKAEGKA